MTSESEEKMSRDPAAETSHLNPDGTRKSVKRNQGHREKKDEKPVVKVPQSLRDKPIQTWWNNS